MFYRTEWVTPVPDFREDLEHQYRIFSLPTFRHPLEANSPLPKRSLRPPKPRIWQPRPQQRPILTQIVLYIIFKLLKYDFLKTISFQEFRYGVSPDMSFAFKFIFSTELTFWPI